MAHQLILVKNGERKNITQLVGNLSWSSNIDALGVELSFDYAYNDTFYFAEWDIVEIGDHILLANNNGDILHRFVVISPDVNGRFSKGFNCFDYAWYLNENETVIQFKNINASNAIRKLLDKFNIKHVVTDISTLINKIYKDEAISDIIKDVLEQAEKETGNKYRMEMNIDTLSVQKQTDLIINPMVRLSENSAPFPVTAAISNPSRKTSIDGMKNRVIVVSSGDDNVNILIERSDDENIAKYGLLTEVVTVDEKNESQARNIAKNTLADLNRIKEDISLGLLGHDDIRAGRILELNEPITGIVGQYVIKSANHSESNGIHKVSVQLGGV
ncbi:XkdQ/YqbQ family protein [Paenibacillus sp. Root444D2]|uniref:XkdQ/YqbQ family protein n=1 Tax=Paenibacillus sp. Root444D2 TaxID=1736538 RepID=UPI00071000B3|nr:hypothetical protein [Paenibacillus sp. Root444D2]KQX69225.1 hypothetical protein ASD40_01625 [Paenibacillus sp. Root444D2]